MNKFYGLINNKLNLNTKKYTLIIGETPSSGARSPKLWNKVYAKNKENLKMYPADISQVNLKKMINYLKKDNFFLGGAVTAPYKELLLKYIDKISKEAQQIGSVNTLKKKNNQIIGYNTDFFGFIETLKKFKFKKNILIFGCGGAGKAVFIACKNYFNSSSFFLINRNKKNLKKFLKKSKFKNFKIINHESIENLKNIDLVINTTSIGFNSWIYRKNYYFNLSFFTPMIDIKSIKGVKEKNNKKFMLKNKKLIEEDTKIYNKFLENNKNCEIIDIIYNPLQTKLLKIGRQKKHRVVNGLKMNFFQAVKAYSIVNNDKNIKRINKIMSKNG